MRKHYYTDMTLERFTLLECSTTQVAQLLGVSVHTLRKRIERSEADRGKHKHKMRWWTWKDILRWEHEFTIHPVDVRLNPRK
jgi:transposase